jgi:hypothetical protein
VALEWDGFDEILANLRDLGNVCHVMETLEEAIYVLRYNCTDSGRCYALHFDLITAYARNHRQMFQVSQIVPHDADW